MNGIEYTERLINDINASIEIRRKVADPFVQIKQLSLTGEHSLENFVAALNVTETDAHLDNLSQFINLNDKLVEHDKGNKVDIEVFQRDIGNNKDKIGQVFQQLLDNKQLIELPTKTPLGTLLVEQLNYVHESVNQGA